jgi:Helix-turn-helix domain
MSIPTATRIRTSFSPMLTTPLYGFLPYGKTAFIGDASFLWRRFVARTFTSPQHDELRAFLAKKRKAAGLKQADLGKLLKRSQDYVSDIETGQKIVGVVELMEWADAIGFDPVAAIKQLKTASRKA